MASPRQNASGTPESITNSHTLPHTGIRTHPSDPRVFSLVDTLRPISTQTDEPRAPVRARLLEQLCSLVDEENAASVRDWIDHEFAEQEQRDRLFTSLSEALAALEQVDSIANETFRTTLAMYDTTAQILNVDLSIYQEPNPWEDDSTSTGVWGNENHDVDQVWASWGDDVVTSNGWGENDLISEDWGTTSHGVPWSEVITYRRLRRPRRGHPTDFGYYDDTDDDDTETTDSSGNTTSDDWPPQINELN